VILCKQNYVYIHCHLQPYSKRTARYC